MSGHAQSSQLSASIVQPASSSCPIWAEGDASLRRRGGGEPAAGGGPNTGSIDGMVCCVGCGLVALCVRLCRVVAASEEVMICARLIFDRVDRVVVRYNWRGIW